MHQHIAPLGLIHLGRVADSNGLTEADSSSLAVWVNIHAGFHPPQHALIICMIFHLGHFHAPRVYLLCGRTVDPFLGLLAVAGIFAVLACPVGGVAEWDGLFWWRLWVWRDVEDEGAVSKSK